MSGEFGSEDQDPQADSIPESNALPHLILDSLLLPFLSIQNHNQGIL
jgi:hypothetical protein